MTMLATTILRFGRRQLHTIISRQIIKPSSPTPSHLKTYNLSQLEQCAPHSYVPLIFFYPNNSNSNLTPDEKSHNLKKSLSKTLTQYYPFAGRLHTLTTPHIDCNDDGVVFVEAKNDSQLDKFQRKINEEEEGEAVGQLFPDGMVWQKAPQKTSLLGVQVNHFACGGMVVAVSMSHRISDGCTLGSFASHWASVARYGSTHINPHYIQSPSTAGSPPPETSVLDQKSVKHVTRKFVFPNSKLSELKNEPKPSINNPTRVEVLTSLIYKTVVRAAATKSGCFKPSFLLIPVDMRRKFVPQMPQTTVGNFVSLMMVKTKHESETSLDVVVSEIKKEKMALDRVQSVQDASRNIESFLLRLGNEDLESFANRSFWCSSLCGFPYHNVDFGWGEPAGATIVLGSSERSGSLLMDAPNGDGIEARVILEEDDMEIFQNDMELLSFCKN